MNTDKTEKPAIKQPPTIKPGDAIAVAMLDIEKAKNQRGIPGKNGDGVLCDPNASANQHRWSCFFLPQIRHFVLTYYTPNTATEANPLGKHETVFVHETHVVRWTALAL